MVFPGAGHLSLAVEAYLQLLVSQQHDLAGVRFRDVDIGKALIVADSDNGIEKHTRLQRLPSSAEYNGWYTFVVESIEDGTWTIHSEGKISGILARNDSRPPAHRFELPFDMDKLHQRTQARRWYDSFHRVGFEYGPSFRTMQAVRANGKDRATCANLQVQRECGLVSRESRYMLHPSTIDGCLHLVITSIHRGLHKEMPWAVVPVEIEEIDLYFPGTDNGIGGRAVAWTDKHWNGRYFNHNTQLQGTSGRLLMNMKNIKSVIYDAALSQTAIDAPTREPYAQVSWKPCFAEVSVSESSSVHSDEVLVSSEPIAIISPQHADAVFMHLKDELGIGSTSASLLLDVEDANLSGEIFNVDNILIDDSAGTLLSKVSNKSFESIKAILCSGKSIIWLTRGVHQGQTVAGGMAQGFLRGVRSELIASRVTLLDVDEEASVPRVAHVILDKLANNATKDSGRDVEFWLRADGSLQVPRIVSNSALTNVFYHENEDVTSPVTAGPSYSGKISENEVVFGIISESQLARREAEIQIKFSEQGPNDLKAQAEKPRIVVGKVTRIGAEVDSLWLGKNFISYSIKPFETRIRSETFVRAVGHDVAHFASVLPSLCQAVDATLRVSNIKAGNHILLLPSPGPFIDAVTKLGKVLGFQVTCPSGTAEHIKETLASFGALNLIIATSSSALTKEAWRHMPSGSKFVLSNVPLDWPLDTKPFARGTSFLSSSISRLFENDQASLAYVLEVATQLIIQHKDSFLQPPRLIDVEGLQDLAALAADMTALEQGVLQFSYGESKVKVRHFCSCKLFYLHGTNGFPQKLRP